MIIYILEVTKSALVAGNFGNLLPNSTMIITANNIIGKVILTSRNGWLIIIIQTTASWNSTMKRRELTLI